MDRLARAIEAVGAHDQHLLDESMRVDRLKSEGALLLYSVCRAFVDALNSRLSDPAVMLAASGVGNRKLPRRAYQLFSDQPAGPFAAAGISVDRRNVFHRRFPPALCPAWQLPVVQPGVSGKESHGRATAFFVARSGTLRCGIFSTRAPTGREMWTATTWRLSWSGCCSRRRRKSAAPGRSRGKLPALRARCASS